MNLFRSITILKTRFFEESINGDPDRVQINSGVVHCAHLPDVLESYIPGAIIPKQDWRPLDHDEWEIVTGTDRSPGSAISLIAIPESTMTRLRSLGLSEVRSELDLEAIQHHLNYSDGILDVVEAISSHFESVDDLEILGLAYRPAGLLTSTKVGSSDTQYPDKLVGLHFDHWSRAPIETRSRVQNRVCINLGTSPRYFYFINLTAMDVLEMCCNAAVFDRVNKNNMHLLLSEFFKVFHDYPVFRVRLEPGEAYIAPTENMIHDGSTLYQSICDIQLTVRGRINHLS